MLLEQRKTCSFAFILNFLVFLSVCLRYVAMLKFLSRSLKSVDSIRNYINGVRILHLYLDYPFPDLENFVYKLLIKELVKTTFSKMCFTNHPRYVIGDGKVFRFI